MSCTLSRLINFLLLLCELSSQTAGREGPGGGPLDQPSSRPNAVAHNNGTYCTTCFPYLFPSHPLPLPLPQIFDSLNLSWHDISFSSALSSHRVSSSSSPFLRLSTYLCMYYIFLYPRDIPPSLLLFVSLSSYISFSSLYSDDLSLFTLLFLRDIPLLIPLFIYLFIYLFIPLFIYLFVYIFIYLLIYLFIY